MHFDWHTVGLIHVPRSATLKGRYVDLKNSNSKNVSIFTTLTRHKISDNEDLSLLIKLSSFHLCHTDVTGCQMYSHVFQKDPTVIWAVNFYIIILRILKLNCYAIAPTSTKMTQHHKNPRKNQTPKTSESLSPHLLSLGCRLSGLKRVAHHPVS